MNHYNPKIKKAVRDIKFALTNLKKILQLEELVMKSNLESNNIPEDIKKFQYEKLHGQYRYLNKRERIDRIYLEELNIIEKRKSN